MTSFLKSQSRQLISRSNTGSGATLETKSANLVGGLADRTIVTLRYVSRVTLTASTIDQSYSFAGNDPYDPDVTGTGGQPNNYDDFSLLYQRQRTIASRIRICPIAAAGSPVSGFTVGARLQSGTGTVENDSSRPRVQFYWNSSSGAKPVVVEFPWQKTGVILGLTEAAVQGSDELASLVSASPAHRWFWHIRHTSADLSTTATAYYEVIIDYRIVFWDRYDGTLDLVRRAEARVLRSVAALDRAKRVARAGAVETKVSHRESATDSDGDIEMLDLKAVAPARLAPTGARISTASVAAASLSEKISKALSR